MKRSQAGLRSAVVEVLIAAASVPAQAAVVTYTDRNAFLAALASSPTDNYTDLGSGNITSPLSRAIPGYTYTAATTGGLYSDSVNGSPAVSTSLASDILTLAFATGAPNTTGGYFSILILYLVWPMASSRSRPAPAHPREQL